jgi:hypothetical protein
LLCPVIAFGAAPGINSPADEPPLVNQPENFSGAVGAFKVSAAARPTAVALGEPVHFTIRVRSTGIVQQPPQRPNLRRLEKFRQRFQIQDLPEQDRTRAVAGGQEWEFHYLLKPLGTDVTAVPALRFDYYKPGSVPRTKGYRATYSRSIPLTVTQIARAAEARPRAPRRMCAIVEGSAVLRSEAAPTLPGPFLVSLAVVLPPAACLAWYLAWRRLYPGAAVTARRRRSRAARLALAALHRDGHPDADTRTKHIAYVMQTYLRQRFDVPPTDEAEQLRRAGCPDELTMRVAEFFRSCDAARFAADLAAGADKLPAAAERLILALEAQQ